MAARSALAVARKPSRCSRSGNRSAANFLRVLLKAVEADQFSFETSAEFEKLMRSRRSGGGRTQSTAMPEHCVGIELCFRSHRGRIGVMPSPVYCRGCLRKLGERLARTRSRKA